MKKSILLCVVCLGGLLLSTACAEKVFYVKPTVPTTECPSGDSPCHSLQYYANHSSFTNNSRFLFLEGEHHLDSVSNVANLSLVGASYGVEILCMSLPSEFHIEEFIRVKIENMVISYRSAGSRNASFELVNGSEVTIDHVTISNCSGDPCTGLWAEEVVGSFSILNSIFMEINGGTLSFNYSFCKLPTILNLTNITLIITALDKCLEAELNLGCSNIYTVITDIQFGMESLQSLCGLVITLTCNNSVMISNFNNGPIAVYKFEKCTTTCAYADVEHPGLHFDQNGIANGTVLIKN